MTSRTPGRFSKAPGSTLPRFPVMPIAVRCVPGMGCAWSPWLWTASTTRRMSSAVATESITINMRVLKYGPQPALSNRIGNRVQEARDSEKQDPAGASFDVSALLGRLGVRHQAQGRLADLRQDEIHGEGRPRDHHARE